MNNQNLNKIDKKDAMAINQDLLAKERTKLSITRTELAFLNSKMSLNRTHLSYLRTIVTLIGSGATIYKALPVLGVSYNFSALLSLFLFVCAGYFIYKDATVYPKMKRELNEMEKHTDELKAQVDNDVFDFDITDL